MPLIVYEILKVENPHLESLLQHIDNMQVCISEDGSEAYINNKKIKFSDLISRSDYYPLSRFVFEKRDLYDTNPMLSIIRSCMNAYTWTQLSSLKLDELACILKSNWPLQIVLYPETKNFHDAFWIAHVPTKDDLEINMEPTYCIQPKYEPTQKHVVKLYSPKPVVSGPAKILPGETVELQFEYRNWNKEFTPCDFDTHIKYNAGYLPKSLVRVIHGRAKVKVTALGLEAGDTITMKFSIGKIYTNAVEHTLTVV